jgi:ferrous iron transport protein B
MTVDLPMTSAVPSQMPVPACGSCAHHNAANLKRLGLNIGDHDVVVALAGNPNTGKSTVFNALTGMRQHVGNWPGTTVSRAEGGFAYNGSSFKVVDLPGSYSLLSNSRDEDVARDFLLFADPDVTVVVVDASRLERNLNLVLQILQVTGKVVLALNLLDEARRHRIEIDVRHLTRELAVPVVPMVARRGEGVPELVRRVEEMASATSPVRRRQQRLASTVSRAVDELAGRLADEYPGLLNARWVALRLLEGDRGTEQALRDGRLENLARQHTARLAS